ncbi:hypothetical protein LCGC14_1981500, partial [marine sediment metagenome]
MNRTFVIQEHDAEQAGLHWDLRFETPVKPTHTILNAPKQTNRAELASASF